VASPDLPSLILDVNLRLWDWHALGKAVGVDFPYLFWRQAVGLPVTSIKTQQEAAWIRQ
jgi:predicted ATP-grasp superfamily ATP-dependent carboligase